MAHQTSLTRSFFSLTGVRVFAVWLFRHRAILPLLFAHGLHVALWGH